MNKLYRFTYLFLLVCLILGLSACAINKKLKKVEVYKTWPYLKKIIVADNHAYLTRGSAEWLQLDTSNPAVPIELESSSMGPADVDYLTVVGDSAYVTDSGNGLYIIDISDPRASVQIGFYEITVPTNHVAIKDHYAYLADTNGGLHIIDISNPATPTKVGIFQTEESPFIVKIENDYAYLGMFASNFRGELHIIDISNPVALIEVAAIKLKDGHIFDIKVVDNYAYIAIYYGLQIVDISEPNNPIIVGTYNTPNPAQSVEIEGNYAYIADTFGIQVVDVSNPTTPTEVGYYKYLRQASDVAIVDDYLYVADGDGLIIFEKPR